MSFSIEEAYRDHGAELFRFAANALSDRADAEELVQEVFTRAWRSAAQFDPARASLRTWLFAIARNLALDVHRARGRRPQRAGEAPEDAGPAAAGPEEDVVGRLQVVEALARLSPEHRQVVVAVHLEGRTYAELAQQTGVAVATLRTRMYYGLRAMRSVLDEAGGEADG
ncbi:RNA polymerase sigma factor [Quadrisphaera sp. DSM 44207]|uniref:RNA polymerase sigma factor n=1 Tax=Quadrisphaera sp. DSM 44207 TaxID=1881057 RepID=UPI0008827540|nr:sigma-70 family RNA polymerase sigma factor [Quadrisphaera sp. DSM 44207]SDQ05879.1 RNA polymerase sigma-70 factor, ECF subfamily [Quadrisphaera sp. DSM 44207]